MEVWILKVTMDLQQKDILTVFIKVTKKYGSHEKMILTSRIL
jgi:hypothetical protein